LFWAQIKQQYPLISVGIVVFQINQYPKIFFSKMAALF